MSLRFRILQRDDFTCQYCGVLAPSSELQVDHIVAKALGGHDGADNLVTACTACNQGKRDARMSPEHILRFRKTEPLPELPRSPRQRRIHVSPGFVYANEEPEYRTCSGCGNRRYYEGDDLCSCRSRFDEERPCELCSEVMEDDDDEICRHCYNRLYVLCEDCEDEDREDDSDYCAQCSPKHPAPVRFYGGVPV